VTDAERREVQLAVERILPLDARKLVTERRKELEEAQWLADALKRAEIKQWYTRATGVTFKNPDGTDRQKIIAKCHQGEPLRLEREPGNIHNPRAVRVLTHGGQQIGYLPDDLVGREGDRGVGWCLGKEMDQGLRVEARIAGIGRAGEHKALGVRIDLAFWNGPLSYQPKTPYFSASGRSQSAAKPRPAAGRGCLGALVLATALIFSLVIFLAVVI
jgi:hypothetical protein